MSQGIKIAESITKPTPAPYSVCPKADPHFKH